MDKELEERANARQICRRSTDSYYNSFKPSLEERERAVDVLVKHGDYSWADSLAKNLCWDYHWEDYYYGYKRPELGEKERYWYSYLRYLNRIVKLRMRHNLGDAETSRELEQECKERGKRDMELIEKSRRIRAVLGPHPSPEAIINMIQVV